jgi:hypothetical protein
MSNERQIDLSKGQSGYDLVGEQLINHWKQTYYSTALVSLELSYNGKDYTKTNEVVSPLIDSDICEWLSDWWEGQEYIRILGIKNIDDIDLFPIKASEVAREIFDTIDDIVESWKLETRSKETGELIRTAYNGTMIAKCLAELKKKYIGKDTNVTTKESEGAE